MPRLWVTSGGTFARERSRKHFTDRMKQSEASRHQPAGKPLSLQADAAGDMRGRQYAPHMRVGGEPHATQQENSDAEIDSRPTGSKQQLVVHVGMDTSTKAIFLEQCGKNRSYRDTDIRGFQPEGGVCLPGGPEVMLSVISMKEVCRRVSVEDVEVAFSRDAGRYVCDYTYYLSLYLGNGHAALLHVPPLTNWLPASLLGKALQVIIQEMLEESWGIQSQKYSSQREAAGGCRL
ncbi:pyroglutamyl-peptidase 1-like protein [Cricetulus griseus]|uniref:Pyroglutamyl-peptidase 1-like protein n=2 Tax=Cricetulus griseus TaxID=10029 RepID=A0A061IIE9_CRIGR|nr:pyroglutamyl-peptidase 1-like protein [Cricetulus griseus]